MRNPTRPQYRLSRHALAERLHRLMVDRGLYQSELARLTGIPRYSVSDYMTGKTYPSEDRLAKLAEVLNVTVQELTKPDVGSQVTIGDADLEIRVLTDRPGFARVAFAKVVSMSAAIQIAQILERESASADGSRSGENSAVQPEQGKASSSDG